MRRQQSEPQSAREALDHAERNAEADDSDDDPLLLKETPRATKRAPKKSKLFCCQMNWCCVLCVCISRDAYFLKENNDRKMAVENNSIFQSAMAFQHSNSIFLNASEKYFCFAWQNSTWKCSPNVLIFAMDVLNYGQSSFEWLSS